MQFDERVKDYLKVRKEQVSQLPKLKPTPDPGDIVDHKKALAAALAEARKNAAPGDIFFPAVKHEFRRIIRQHYRRHERAAIAEEKPHAVKVAVNKAYPEKTPVSTVPPLILMALPQLPKELEYRFVNHALILHDREADLIVDYIPGAIP